MAQAEPLNSPHPTTAGSEAAGPRWIRKSERLPVLLRGCCRSRSGFRDDVVITDISAEGCRVESRSSTLRTGDLVLVRLQGLEGQTGTVCWTENTALGIRFDRPLYGPVVEHLVRTHGTFWMGGAGARMADYRIAC